MEQHGSCHGERELTEKIGPKIGPILFINPEQPESHDALTVVEKANLAFKVVETHNPEDTTPLLMVAGEWFMGKDRIARYTDLLGRNGGQDPWIGY